MALSTEWSPSPEHGSFGSLPPSGCQWTPNAFQWSVQVRIVAILGAALAAVTLSLEAASGANERADHAAREGGTFSVAVAAGFFDTIDPALVDFPAEVQLLAPACASLMAYPNKPPPEGLRVRPDLAEAEPVVSKNGRTYTFTIRRDARFSSGAPVTAHDFAHAFERIFSQEMQSQSPLVGGFRHIMGAQDVLAGKATTLRGVVAKGRTLTLRLTKRVPDLLDGTTGLCAVPASLPTDPEGAKAPLPSPAPYYVAEYVPGERLVLERNRFYRGQRPHHVDRIVADLGADAGAIIDEIASGKLDWGWAVPTLRARARELKQRYGVNKSQFFVQPAGFLRLFVLNTSRPLFRNNPKLRQAVNFAVDRKALTRELGPLAGTPTDKYLSPSQPGYRDERIYPLKAPDLRRARALAEGRTRSGKAVLYTRSDPVDVAQAQVLQQNLKAIGLEVEIMQFPGTLIFEKLATEGTLFDIGRIAWGHSADPFWFSGIFDGRTIGRPDNINWSYFNSPKYNRLFDEVSRLTGDERSRAYGELDVQLSRDAAPAIPIANLNEPTFVSARVGCVVVNPGLDLTAVCLK